MNKIRAKYLAGLIFCGIILLLCPTTEADIVDKSGIMLKMLKKNTFYRASFDDSTKVYFCINTLTDNELDGDFFVYNGSSMTMLEKFVLHTGKTKKYVLGIRNREYTLRLRIQRHDSSFVASYADTHKRKGFFRRLQWSNEIIIDECTPQHYIRYPERYKSLIFNNIAEETDIVYGKAEGYWTSYETENESYAKIIKNGILSTLTKEVLPLKLDIYYPTDDTLARRPLLMFIHGGGFYIGDKQTKAIVGWCRHFSQLGYVTASINYRLGFKPVGASVERAGYRAAQDANAAMRFLVANASKYRIDTSRLFVAGSSAGAITALNLAFMRTQNRPESAAGSIFSDDLGAIDNCANDIKQSFDIKAVVNMWGAVHDLEILRNSHAAILSFHGDEDKVVPIDYDYPFSDLNFGINKLLLNKTYGSRPIHQRAKQLGLRQELHVYEKAGHSLHVDKNDNLNQNYKTITNDITTFLYSEIFPQRFDIQPVMSSAENGIAKRFRTGCSHFNDIGWNIDGGFIIEAIGDNVTVVWFKNAAQHRLYLSLLPHDPCVGFNDVYELKMQTNGF